MKNVLLSLALVFASTGAFAGNPSWPTNSGSIGSAASGATLDDSAGPIIDAVSTATCASGWYIDVDRDAVKDADEPCVNPKYTHATDCTALTIGILGDTCFEQDSAQLFECEPSAGGCDSAAEWKRITGGRVIYLPASGDIAAIVNAAPPYTTFYMVPNATYDIKTWSQGLLLKTGQTLDGRGAIISGAKDFTPGSAACPTWTHDAGPPEVWGCFPPWDFKATDPSDPYLCNPEYQNPPYSHGNLYCRDAVLWVYPNLQEDTTSADFSEAALAQAGTKSRVELIAQLQDANDPDNEFYYSTASHGIVLRTDPAGKSVVLNDGQDGFGGTDHVFAVGMGNWPFTGARSNGITVKNLTVQFLASTPHNNGAIWTGRCDNCVVDNVRVRFNQGLGIACFESKNFEVKNSYITDNTGTGYAGCWQNSDDGVWEATDGEKVHDNYFARNGNGQYDPTFGAGNLKLAAATNGHIYRNKIVDAGLLIGRTSTNPGGRQDSVHGLWIDTQYAGWLIENNFIARNGAAGIYVEVSCNGVIRHNYIANNFNGVLVGASHQVLVDSNVLSNNSTGVQLAYQGTRLHQNFNAAPLSGWTSPCIGASDWDARASNITVESNTFQMVGPSSPNYNVQSVFITPDSMPSDNFVFKDNCYDAYATTMRPPVHFVVADYNGSGLPNTWYTFASWKSTFGFDTTGSRETTEFPGECFSIPTISDGGAAGGPAHSTIPLPQDGE